MRRILLLACAVPLFAQQPEAPPPGGPPGPHRQMPEPKNLQVLKPGPDLIPTMRSYTVALGVQCNFCHVQGNFASDDKPQKVMARMMIKMTADVNSKFADNQIHVACYTCHRGSTEPLLKPAGGGEEHHDAPPPPPPAPAAPPQ